MTARVAKRFRLLRRRNDGSAVLESSDADGYAMLFVKPDGSRFIHEVSGICPDCVMARHARADCPRGDRESAVKRPVPVAEPSPAPVADVPVAEPVKPKRTVVELKPVPDPADEALERDARSVAQSVWFRGGRHRNQLLQGQSQMYADRLLAYAVERGWLRVDAEGIVSPGTESPAKTMPDTRSRREKVLAWGPGPGADW
jgi:hypothetical protein